MTEVVIDHRVMDRPVEDMGDRLTGSLMMAIFGSQSVSRLIILWGGELDGHLCGGL